MILTLPTASKSLGIKICKNIGKDVEIMKGGRRGGRQGGRKGGRQEGRKGGRKAGKEEGRKTAGAHPPE